MEKKKYKCDPCNFTTDFKSLFEKHCTSKKHNNNGILRSDKKNIIHICEECPYTTKCISSFKEHIIKVHKTDAEKKELLKYYCNYCKYGTMMLSKYNIHLNNQKN